jgi:YesN/AraC family two-component response regulator
MRPAFSNKPNILIIDDECCFIASMKELLSEEFHILSAENGKVGLEILREGAVDLVLLDYRLPDLSGIEVLKEIRNSYPALPVFMISGHASKNVVISAWNERADCYLDKPLDIEVLRQKLYRYLRTNCEDPVLNIDASALSPLVSKIIKMINENPFSSLTVRDIAYSLSMNPDYLSCVFKKQTGKHLHHYLLAFKISKSKKLLMGGRFNVKEIGYRLGFTSPNAFYKAFKKVANLSPTEYRMTLSKDHV